jgi:hypothetical protein
VHNPGQEDANENGIGDVCEQTCDCTGFCDVDPGGGINPVDVAYLVAYVFTTQDARHPLPDCPTENGDWDCNYQVDPLDVAYMVSYVYQGMGTGPCDPCTGLPLTIGQPDGGENRQPDQSGARQ